MRHGVAVADIEVHPAATDPRLWSTDRLHTSPLGHARIAAAVAQALDLPGSDATWTHPLPAPDRPAAAWMAGRCRRTPLGRRLPRPLGPTAAARPLLRRRPYGETPRTAAGAPELTPPQPSPRASRNRASPSASSITGSG